MLKKAKDSVVTAKGHVAKRAPSSRTHKKIAARVELDPSFYKDIWAFRKAVEEGTVDVSKACHNMNEYHWSLEHA